MFLHTGASTVLSHFVLVESAEHLLHFLFFFFLQFIAFFAFILTVHNGIILFLQRLCANHITYEFHFTTLK